MGPSLDIVIVNWNAGSQLQDCLRSILDDLESINLARVVVVDNASSDGSLDGCQSLGLPLTIIRNDENRGFGAACNQGVRGSRADCLLFLNPDTRVHPGALGKAMTCLESGKSQGIGIVGVQLVDAQGCPHRSCARFPSFFGFLNEMLGLAKVFPKRFRGVFMRDWEHAGSREVDHVMGAFAMMRRSLFEALQGFDEGFFMYLEDLDLSVRARNSGWRSFYLAEAQVYHKSGGTSEQIKAQRLSYLLRSRFRYARKHLGAVQTWVIVGLTFSVELVLRVTATIRIGDWSGPVETVEAYASLSRDILKKRLRR